ncbi:MAG: Rieske 2Fe-2S domain-containing protein [Rhodospirillaceae bacterium]|jgi:nitrite reductase/ring-hydroxylating ferredoxin subunit|nr:Rieske 2Fe-2S domain-containing protein [Rhodospirillaceae bacterium]MBT6138869.1 Rieske 2Fe-2S domain-containing protein [Rhodospirillaceae bacterium]
MPEGAQTMSESAWVKAMPLADLQADGSRIFKTGDKQLAVFWHDGRVLACNNRCPHEGYPLKEGTLDGKCVLTCNWHNWKFDLETGENMLGGDTLRTYPTEVRDGAVWVDVSEAPASERIAAALANLKDSFPRHEYDRMAREIARLAKAGGDPLEAVRQAIRWTHDQFEFGATHALAAAPDWLALRARTAKDEATSLIPLVEAVGHFAWDTMRWGHYPYPEGTADFDPGKLIEAIETEDEASAIAQVRGAIAGPGYEALAEPLARAAAAHYQDFGHSMIYSRKAPELIAALGEEMAEPVYLMLVRGMVFARREDLIPEFSAYRPARDAWDGSGTGTPKAADFHTAGVKKAVSLCLDASADPIGLYHALLEASCWQMLHFELNYSLRHDRPVQDNVGWLDFTHMITFANAGRMQAERWPDLWPDVLLQMACFTGRNATYVDATLETDKWTVANPAGFVEERLDAMIDHGEFEYIVACHYLKLTTAMREELLAKPQAPWGPTMAAALNRLVNSPLKRKHLHRVAVQSLDFVARED